MGNMLSETSTSMRAHRPTTPGLAVRVSHQPGGELERTAIFASKSFRREDSFTRSSLVKSVPIHEPSIIDGGIRIVLATRGRYIHRFSPTRSVAVPASRDGDSTRISALSSPLVHALTRMVRVLRDVTTVISTRATLLLDR